jgi:hypothetical protein
MCRVYRLVGGALPCSSFQSPRTIPAADENTAQVFEVEVGGDHHYTYSSPGGISPDGKSAYFPANPALLHPLVRESEEAVMGRVDSRGSVYRKGVRRGRLWHRYVSWLLGLFGVVYRNGLRRGRVAGVGCLARSELEVEWQSKGIVKSHSQTDTLASTQFHPVLTLSPCNLSPTSKPNKRNQSVGARAF